MSDEQTDDPLGLYLAFRQAVIEWVHDNSGRFVRPAIEYWPEGVDSQEEASEHYGEQAANEIIENLERILAGDDDDG